MTGFPMERAGLPAGFMTFDDVQERLIEAVITSWRLPDRHRAWLRVRSAWPDVLRELAAGDYDARGGLEAGDQVEVRPASLTRADHDEMEEAFGWMAAVSQEDRRLVAMVIGELARGQREVSWRRMLGRMGLTRGADGLRMRYGRAIQAIAAFKNGGNPRAVASTPEIITR